MVCKHMNELVLIHAYNYHIGVFNEKQEVQSNSRNCYKPKLVPTEKPFGLKIGAHFLCKWKYFFL